MARSRRRRQPGPAPAAPERDEAMEIAARFLATRPRSRREVEQRLQRAGTEEAVVASTLERLERLGYVDDVAFVRWWLDQRDRHAPRGRRMVEAELRQRGVGREAIEQLRAMWDEPDRGPGDERLPGTDEDRAAVALERHLRGRPLPDDPRALQRLGMFLVRRGFDPATARGAIRAARQSDGREPDAEDSS